VRAGMAADSVEQRKRGNSQPLRRQNCSPRWQRALASGGEPAPPTVRSDALQSKHHSR
jgi:hypothetical protein